MMMIGEQPSKFKMEPAEITRAKIQRNNLSWEQIPQQIP
jgi:hypothetical protein